MTFSLSTSWNYHRHSRAIEMINEIKDLGFDTVELNFALTKDIVEDIISMKNNSLIKVSSVHNMCPLPDNITQKDASPDYYSLSSNDQKERALAVEIATNTLHCAKKVGAKAIVLHAGRVDIKDRTRRLASLINEKERLSKLRTEMINERKQVSGTYLENAIDSLKTLVPVAKRLNVSIGIENRYYYREIPTSEELEIIFSHFPEGDLYYWHDSGHAEVFERLGLDNHAQLLERFANRLIGMHLHDIMGPINDHRAPGQGTFDFTFLRRYLQPDTIKVIEVHHPATADDIRKGVDMLNNALGYR